MKSVINKETDIYKDSGIDDEINEATPQQVIDESQTIINELEIKDGSAKEIGKCCTYLKEEYFERRSSEKLLRPYVKVMPDEIVIPKLVFGEVFECEEGTTNFRR
jgi:hypothetical protein